MVLEVSNCIQDYSLKFWNYHKTFQGLLLLNSACLQNSWKGNAWKLKGEQEGSLKWLPSISAGKFSTLTIKL